MKKISILIAMTLLSISASAREWAGNNGGRWGGCVVEGTLVTLKDGRQKAIEKVLESDRILSNTKEDFAPLLRIRGPENIPLYQIRTTSGKTVVATEGHPFILGNKMTLVSKELKIGMILRTIDGLEAIESITLVPGGKIVYNLILSSDNSLRQMYKNEFEAKRMDFNIVEYQRRLDPFLGLNSAQHSYYINGIASGDLVIQQAVKN